MKKTTLGGRSDAAFGRMRPLVRPLRSANTVVVGVAPSKTSCRVREADQAATTVFLRTLEGLKGLWEQGHQSGGAAANLARSQEVSLHLMFAAEVYPFDRVSTIALARKMNFMRAQLEHYLGIKPVRGKPLNTTFNMSAIPQPSISEQLRSSIKNLEEGGVALFSLVREWREKAEEESRLTVDETGQQQHGGRVASDARSRYLDALEQLSAASLESQLVQFTSSPPGSHPRSTTPVLFNTAQECFQAAVRLAAKLVYVVAMLLDSIDPGEFPNTVREYFEVLDQLNAVSKSLATKFVLPPSSAPRAMPSPPYTLIAPHGHRSIVGPSDLHEHGGNPQNTLLYVSSSSSDSSNGNGNGDGNGDGNVSGEGSSEGRPSSDSQEIPGISLGIDLAGFSTSSSGSGSDGGGGEGEGEGEDGGEGEEVEVVSTPGTTTSPEVLRDLSSTLRVKAVSHLLVVSD